LALPACFTICAVQAFLASLASAFQASLLEPQAGVMAKIVVAAASGQWNKERMVPPETRKAPKASHGMV
jgi:hypothetical protein